MEQLLERVALEDVAAFDALYLWELPIVRGIARQLLRDRSQSDEVAQEVMLQVWQRARQFDPTLGSGHAWIVRLARGRAIDRVRMCARSRSRDHSYAAERLRWDVADDVAATVLSRLDAARAHDALLGLSTAHREVLVLAFFAGLSYPQIALSLDVPLGTIKTRIRDALIKLRSALARDELRGRAA